MPELSEREKRKIVEEFRQRDRDNRKRRRPDYTTISVAEAKRDGYRPLTSSYSTRQFDQCAMLDAVIKDFAKCDIKLVRVGVRKNMIEVWRKVWDRQRAPKKVQRVGRKGDDEVSAFVGGLIDSLLS